MRCLPSDLVAERGRPIHDPGRARRVRCGRAPTGAVAGSVDLAAAGAVLADRGVRIVLGTAVDMSGVTRAKGRPGRPAGGVRPERHGRVAVVERLLRRFRHRVHPRSRRDRRPAAAHRPDPADRRRRRRRPGHPPRSPSRTAGCSRVARGRGSRRSSTGPGWPGCGQSPAPSWSSSSSSPTGAPVPGCLAGRRRADGVGRRAVPDRRAGPVRRRRAAARAGARRVRGRPVEVSIARPTRCSPRTARSSPASSSAGPPPGTASACRSRPSPSPAAPGTARTCTCRWRDADGPVFSGGSGPHGMTPRGAAAVAGIVAGLPDLQGVLAGSVLSPLRLEPGNWAGAFACWGLENREAAVRFVEATAGNPHGANVELKAIDGSANAYLAGAALLGLALDGIDRDLPLPPRCRSTPRPCRRRTANASRWRAADRGARRARRLVAGPPDPRRRDRRRDPRRAALRDTPPTATPIPRRRRAYRLVFSC